MIARRNFLKLGALFVPAAAPTVAYSFLCGARGGVVVADQLVDFDWDSEMREFERRIAAALQVPEQFLRGAWSTK